MSGWSVITSYRDDKPYVTGRTREFCEGVVHALQREGKSGLKVRIVSDDFVKHELLQQRVGES